MGELLADHTTLRLGGPADYWLTHTDPASWPEVVQAVAGRRPFILGGGSNTLAGDGGYPRPVVRMATRGITARTVGDSKVEVTVHAGEPLACTVAYAAAEGLSGIEYLGGIPGTIGAAPVQNAGAYGQQIADCLTSVTAWDWDRGHTVRLEATACQFRYRSSVFRAQPSRWVILAVTLHLSRSQRAAPVTYKHLAQALDVPLGSRPPLAEAAAGVIADRQVRGLTLPDSGPDMRQAGSVFLNPPVTESQANEVRAAGGRTYRDRDGVLRASAGWLLEQCGYGPGRHVAPGVYCSTRRTLTVTARDGATATSFREGLRSMARTVCEASGIELRPEPVAPLVQTRI
ncbi:UDP-N-acetylmuramate dehydrogenase [Streptomyces coeruleorubidus]|uniref:UDP-N-acetylmuramate dehydrogenase n=1 Tax=Streptomyces coeruleorubidus TaxID=116188 RepID=UPI00237F789C|nr:UDP-N-acetylmuramate dehydrogenase [Streptomyces coeruleorubidus]WDV56656.1 UDP-N-acetylmuramate dehydrogenase [Streptomyces coeruleorubidus]